MSVPQIGKYVCADSPKLELCATDSAGCYAFGHSGGAQVAIRREAQHPGTFAAIYAYEPVYLPSGGGSSIEYGHHAFADAA